MSIDAGPRIAEPDTGSVVAYWHEYEAPGAGGKRFYTFCAIRIDSDNPRRWFLSGGSNAIRGSAPKSPCSWSDVVEHATGPIQVASSWTTLTP